MPLPLAYFLTWTCYGTWLHGDPRGSVDAAHNQLGSPRIAEEPARFQIVATRMAVDAFTLSREARAIVDETIRRHCAFRRWRLWAANVRTTHVHAVVDCGGVCGPESAMGQLKAWSTRRLREASIVDGDQRIWTEHGSTRWIDTQESLARAIEYVLNEQ